MAFTGKATYSAGADLPELAEDVSDIIGIVSPHETALLDHLGDATRDAESTIHEWVEDALLPNRALLADQTFGPAPETATAFILEDVSAVRPGDLLRPDGAGEVMLVDSVDQASGAVLVVRGYGGTTPATLESGGALTILGNASLEGAGAPEPRFTARVRRRNFTQILTATVEVSGSMQAARAHAVRDEYEYQKQLRLRELLRDLENCVVNGVAPGSTPEGSATGRRSMNGIIPLIQTNAFEPGEDGMPDGDDGALDESLLNAAMRRVWEQSSGRLDTIVVGGAQKRRLNAFATGARAYLPEDTRYQDMVSVYESDFGVCRIVMSRWVPADTLILLDSSRVEVMPLRGRSFHHRPLAATGDAARGQVIGEYTLELRNENAHGVVRGLAA